MKRVAKTIEFMGVVAKINDPQCEFLLLCACAGISKLYFPMRTYSPWVFERAQSSFDAALVLLLKYAYLASRLESASLQTELLRHSGFVMSRPTFDDALCPFNAKMEIKLLSNTSDIAAQTHEETSIYIFPTCYSND